MEASDVELRPRLGCRLSGDVTSERHDLGLGDARHAGSDDPHELKRDVLPEQRLGHGDKRQDLEVGFTQRPVIWCRFRETRRPPHPNHLVGREPRPVGRLDERETAAGPSDDGVGHDIGQTPRPVRLHHLLGGHSVGFVEPKDGQPLLGVGCLGIVQA